MRPNTGRVVRRNRVCEVVIRDSEGSWRALFGIEGDKAHDRSLYIVKYNHANAEVPYDFERARASALQYSYHATLDTAGLVQTHMQRAGKKFGIRRQTPLALRTRPLFEIHHAGNDDVRKYPVRVPSSGDIQLTHKSEILGDYRFIFSTKSVGLWDHLLRHDLFIISTRRIPLKFVPEVHFTVAVPVSRLIEIQQDAQ